jgi:Zn-dependent M32 family carboxypeptidase
MDKSDNDRFINEIIHRAELQEYATQVNDMVSIIQAKGFSVSCRYDSLQSVIEWGQNLIRISAKEDLAHPLHSLWSLFHETGHLINGYNADKKISETAAWGFATGIVGSQLPLKMIEFTRFKEHCMNSHELHIVLTNLLV